MEALCLDVLNSDWRDFRRAGAGPDQLDDAVWRRALAERWELRWALAGDGPAWSGLRAARSRLREVAAHIEAGGITEEDLAYLNDALARRALCQRLEGEGDGYRLALVAEPGPDRLAGAVAREAVASFARLVARAELRRIKLCANPDCRWAFYDATRNLRRRWCDSATCGNLMKVRRFRARRRAPDGPGDRPAGL